jgi:hypothetical protein
MFQSPECIFSVKAEQVGKSQIPYYAKQDKEKLTQRNRFSNELARGSTSS